MNPTTRALLVMVLDEDIRAFLRASDPKALEQAIKALKENPEVSDEHKARLTTPFVRETYVGPEDIESAYD
jgi:hypothetical protein